MPLTQIYVNPALNSNSGTGTIGDPYGDLQYALDTQARDSTNGDQFNIVAGVAEVLATPLSLATYGAPAIAAPLVLRGCTTVAGDGGRGAIRGTVASPVINWYGENKPYAWLVDLDFEATAAGNYEVVSLRNYGGIVNCSITTEEAVSVGLQTHSNVLTAGNYIAGFIHRCIYHVGVALITHNYLHMATSGMGGATTIYAYSVAGSAVYTANIIVSDRSNAISIACAPNTYAAKNIIYNKAGGWAVPAIQLLANSAAENNIICNYSKAGGSGIKNTGVQAAIGPNAFWNNTANYDISDTIVIDRRAHDVQLAADPFVDAANGDFRLTDAAKLALAGKGWPGQYLGAHANTVSNLNIGPIQMAAGGGASIYRRVARLLGG